MPIPDTRPDREFDAFDEASDGRTVRRVNVIDPVVIEQILQPIDVQVDNGNKDFFNNTVISEVHNQVEVPFDDVNWQDYATLTTANGGSATQANGQVTINTNTNANGRAALISKDSVKYRPNHEIGFGFTWKMPTASIAGVTIRVGATDNNTTWANSIHFRHKNGTFSLVYTNNGVEVLSAVPSTWLDKCDGLTGSNFKDLSGNPVAIDITKDQLCRIHCGLFGHAGFTVELLAPNQKWVTIYKYTNLNIATIPVFSNFDLSIGSEVVKVAAGAANYTLASACWAGWTGSSFQRINSTITDRTLATVTRTVIEGKTTGGGGGYVPVKVTPSGALTTENTIVDITAVVGQETMANSLPVVIASDQSSVPASQSGTWNINNITGTVSLPTGAATSALQTTGNSSLSSIDGKLNSLGQKIMDASVPVTIASDQSPVDAGVILGDQYSPTTPDTGTEQTKLLVDPDNQLKIRGDVLTDEGTFRDDFSGELLSDIWTQTVTGNGSIAVASSLVTISSGTANANVTMIDTTGDYGPISLRTSFSLSQRVANQTTEIGFKDDCMAPNVGAYFRFTGTNNLVVDCVSQSSSDPSDFQTTTATFSKGFSSAVASEYYIEVQPDQVTFIINGIQVAQHKLHIPGPYDAVNICAGITNQAVVTNTNLIFDYIYFINQNSLQINNSFDGDSLPVRIKSGTLATYGAAVANFTYANLGTDIFTITGSDTKTVRIKHISIDGTQQATATRTVALIKRSAPNVGGTSVVLTNVPYDSSNPAGTAVVRYYTANPTTLGTAVGTFHTEKLLMPAVGTSVEDQLVFETVDATNSQDITLRGSTEVLAINMQGVTSNNNSMNVDVMWTEE